MSKTRHLGIGAVCKQAVRLDKWKTHDVTGDGINETFCNFFVNHVAESQGCKDFVGDKWPLLANQMVAWMSLRWQMLDPDEAQEQANAGQLVIAGWSNKEKHGHVAVVIPGNLTWSKSHHDDVPLCANVGINNFYGRPVSYAFKSSQKPQYFMWLKPKEES